MWQTPEDRLALLELLVRGSLKLRRAQITSYQALAELPWTRATGRRDEIAVVGERRPELVALIDRVWTEWRETLADLTARGLPPTPEGWSKLHDARRAEGLPALPQQLNRRTAASLSAPHSKATLTPRRLTALGTVGTTHDGSVRLRPPRGLLARTRRGTVDLAAITEILGEVSIPERAFNDDLAFEGSIRAVLLVENLGAWRDLPALEGWLFAHVAGWNTATVVLLLERMGRVPLLHFGDLDPNGARIYFHLRNLYPNLQWFVPSFWRERLVSNGLPAEWPDDLDLTDAPELVRDLAHRGLWLEQEPLVIDSRIPSALESTL